MHSSTKFIAGHSDAIGGVLVVRDAELANRLRHEREDYGLVPGSLETWLTLRSLRTLELRILRQSTSAAELAAWLTKRVPVVWHPSIETHPNHDVVRRQMRGMGGGLLSFALDRSESAQKLPKTLRLFRDATSLGGTESLLEWRHKHDPDVSPCLLRVSVGLEAPADLIGDLESGLRSLGALR